MDEGKGEYLGLGEVERGGGLELVERVVGGVEWGKVLVKGVEVVVGGRDVVGVGGYGGLEWDDRLERGRGGVGWGFVVVGYVVV